MKYFKKHWPIFIIFLLGLIPLIWFKDGLIITGGDNPIFLNPGSNFFDNYYSWFGKMDTGTPNMFKSLIFPFMFIWFVLGKIGLSVSDIQKIWLFLVTFFMPGIFMYFLVKEFYDLSGKKGIVAGFIASLLYVFNQYVILDILRLRYIFTLLPLLFLVWVRGLKEEKFTIKYCMLFALISGLCASDANNFAFVAPIASIFILYFVFQLFEGKRFVRSTLFFLTTFTFVLLINFWWILSFVVNIISSGSTIFSTLKANAVFLNSTKIHEVFRFMGFWAFREKFYLDQVKLVSYVPYAFRYYQLPLLLTTYLVPFFAFGSMLFVRQRRRKIFFCFVALLGIFLTKGPNPPFGFIYLFLFNKFSFFSAFREPFSKFMSMHLFAIPILVGFFSEDCFDYFQEKFQKKKDLRYYFGRLVILFIVIVILTDGFPLFSGMNIQNEKWYGDKKASLFVKIPDYWQEAKDWFSQNDSKSRVMLSPITYYGYGHSWPLGIKSGEPVARFLIPNPIVRYPPAIVAKSDLLQIIAYQRMIFDSGTDLLPYFDLLAVNYVLQQNDVFPAVNTQVVDPITMGNILKNQRNLKLLESFGKFDYYQMKDQTSNFVGTISGLDIYKINREGLLPLIYQSKSVAYVDAKIEAFSDIFTFLKYDPGSVFIFSKDIQPKDFLMEDYSNVLVSLKNQPLQKKQKEVAYKFELPQAKSYQLLINGYLLQPEFNTDKRKYYLNLSGRSIPLPDESKNNWEQINLGYLKSGEYLLTTNLPVEVIKEEYFTSPIWLLGEVGKNLKKENSSLSFTKINPTKYKVEIEDGKSSYFIVLSESFNSGWKIYQGKEEIAKGNHFMANGFANGWYIGANLLGDGINKKEIIIEYAPQRLDDISMTISLASVGILLLSLLYILVRGKNNKTKINMS